MRFATKGWIAVGLTVAAVEILAPKNELLSEGVDRALEHKIGRILVPLAVIQTAAHLLNVIPSRYDLIHQGFRLLKAVLNPKIMES